MGLFDDVLKGNVVTGLAIGRGSWASRIPDKPAYP